MSTKERKTGAELIAEERQRQISQEGWTPEHDDGHREDELAKAAMCYAMPNRYRDLKPLSRNYHETFWPWEQEFWKPSPNDRVRELTKAGALIAAEIDRLQRLQETK